MGNLTFQQIFRYALPGGITLLILLGVYKAPGSESGGHFDVTSIGGAAVLSGVALVVGGLIYTLHRAIAYPIIYRLLLFAGPLRLDRAMSRAWWWNILWTSREELERDIRRWKERTQKDSPVSELQEWGTQIHYLYCSCWAIIVGHLLGLLLGWATRSTLYCLSGWLLLVFFAAGVYHHARHLYFESKVMRDAERSKSSTFGIPIKEKHELYEIGTLALVGTHSDHKLAPNIDQGGNVHLNVLEPGAKAGNHYHKKVQEFFINPGPGELLLHLKNVNSNLVETVNMLPASLSEIKAYHPRLGVPHIIENRGTHQNTLIIVVDKDNPSDVYPISMGIPTNIA
ncbi:MAG: hypothetical protein FVQ84_17655 [Planctomycetes bacterium]|nr:hypothetical protein [Planctomycetota bacterium]